MNVTVCVPTYNAEPFLADTLRSILTQRHADLECLIVDDHSTDGTLEVASAFSADPRVRVVAGGERAGIAGNWNRCLREARGKFIAWFNHDDLMLPENLAVKVGLLERDPDICLVHSAAEVLNDASAPNVMPPYAAREDCVEEGRTFLRRLLLEGNQVWAPTVVARRAAMTQTGGFDTQLSYACDYEMWMRLCAHGRVAFLREPLVRYRWHAGNATHGFRDGKRAEEEATACRHALDYYRGRTGEHEEADLLEAALEAVLSERRLAGQLYAARARLAEAEAERAALRSALDAVWASRWQRLGDRLRKLLRPFRRPDAA